MIDKNNTTISENNSEILQLLRQIAKKQDQLYDEILEIKINRNIKPKVCNAVRMGITDFTN
ncbi:hypothetical protein KKC45_00365 [Patescibacteria group bacterium]|nr:hypothetical protein [Patescibacteria group bacterium]